MRFEDLNWFDVEQYLKTDDRLLLVLGSCEQHASLSLLTDVKIPMALAEAASQKTGVLGRAAAQLRRLTLFPGLSWHTELAGVHTDRCG